MKKANAAMPTTPAASPSSPSMKLTAFVDAMTTSTVKSTSTGVGRIVVPKIGSESSCTPV